MNCTGRGDLRGEHCCWIDGAVCPFYDTSEGTPKDKACSLRRILGSWEAVYADARYQAVVQPTFDRILPGYGCGDYPQNIPIIMESPQSGKCCWEVSE